MSDAKINQYLAEMRRWPKCPTDYDAKTEDIIRRILNGDLKPPYGHIDGTVESGSGPEAQPEGVHEPATPDAGADWQKKDAKANYELAIETIRHERDK